MQISVEGARVEGELSTVIIERERPESGCEISDVVGHPGDVAVLELLTGNVAFEMLFVYRPC